MSDERAALMTRVYAAPQRHAHGYTATRHHLEALAAAGWSATGIVTLSQLVAFLAFQLRAATGLAVLHATARPAASQPATSTGYRR